MGYVSYVSSMVYIWVCLKIVYPIVPNGFHDHYPVFKWLYIIGNIPNMFRQTLKNLRGCQKKHWETLEYHRDMNRDKMG